MTEDYKVYPKQYRFEKAKVIKNKCFFVMPFDEEFDMIYGVLRKSLTESGYICSRVDEIPKSTPIISKIINEILNSQFIIVDLTGCNPNVFYELGIAHSFKEAQNILLIKRKDAEVPFDIMHLTYFEYDENNLKYISSTIKQNLKSVEYLYDFNEIIEEKGITQLLIANHDEFIDDLKCLLGDDILDINNILNYKANLSSNELNDILHRLESKIKSYIAHTTDEKVTCVFNFLYEVLISSQNRDCIKNHVDYLLGDYFINTNLSELQILSLKTDLVLKFARENIQLPSVMPWIVEYFTRSKSANIDLNRYKLESFLLITENKEINGIISNAVRNTDCHIREHFADIIGEKRLYEANQTLRVQLSVEKNYYTAVSIIEALGKLGEQENVDAISEWLQANEDEIINTKHYFVFKHIYIAYKKLDSVIARTFYETHKRYLKEFFI